MKIGKFYMEFLSLFFMFWNILDLPGLQKSL